MTSSYVYNRENGLRVLPEIEIKYEDYVFEFCNVNLQLTISDSEGSRVTGGYELFKNLPSGLNGVNCKTAKEFVENYMKVGND